MQPLSPTIRALLFDFDGTLVDSEYLHHESWLAAVAEWGVSVGWEEYKSGLVGISDTLACDFFLTRAGMEPTAERIAEGCSRKHAVYRRRSREELSIDPRVLRWIGDHHRTVPMGVVSSSAIPDVVPILRRQGVADCMRFVICGDHVRRLKPDPEPYLLALDRMRPHVDRLESAECLVFEDSSTGRRAAEAAGLSVHVVDQPGDLPGALDAWKLRIPSLASGRTHLGSGADGVSTGKRSSGAAVLRG